MKPANFMNEGLDFKRLSLFFKKKIWIVLLMFIIGGGLGTIGYQVIRSVSMPVEYKAVSKLYIKFNADENGEVYQYYNGYTWNELLDSDPVMDCIMAYLPSYSSEKVSSSTVAEILSDIRLLTVTVTGENEKEVREIQAAVENGLTIYAINSDELQSIKTIRTVAPERVYWKDKTTSTAILFAIIFGLVTFFIFFFMFIMDDAIYVQSDLEKRYNYKVLGVMPRSQKGLQPYLQELKANILYTVKSNKKIYFIDIDEHGDLRAQDLERILNYQEGGSLNGMVWHVMDDEDDNLLVADNEKEWTICPINSENVDEAKLEELRKAGGVFILIPFGVEWAARKLERTVSLLSNQEVNINGMIITDADEEYLMRYYS